MSTIEITPKAGEYYASTSFGMAVTGVEDMTSARTFSPDRLSLTFEYSSESGTWALAAWTVGGYVRQKSGRLSSKLRGKRSGYGFNARELTNTPDWVIKAAEWYRPTGPVIFRRSGTVITEDVELVK
jgi:hypothetical protein